MLCNSRPSCVPVSRYNCLIFYSFDRSDFGSFPSGIWADFNNGLLMNIQRALHKLNARSKCQDMQAIRIHLNLLDCEKKEILNSTNCRKHHSFEMILSMVFRYRTTTVPSEFVKRENFFLLDLLEVKKSNSLPCRDLCLFNERQ